MSGAEAAAILRERREARAQGAEILRHLWEDAKHRPAPARAARRRELLHWAQHNSRWRPRATPAALRREAARLAAWAPDWQRLAAMPCGYGDAAGDAEGYAQHLAGVLRRAASLAEAQP